MAMNPEMLQAQPPSEFAMGLAARNLSEDMWLSSQIQDIFGYRYAELTGQPMPVPPAPSEAEITRTAHAADRILENFSNPIVARLIAKQSSYATMSHQLSDSTLLSQDEISDEEREMRIRGMAESAIDTINGHSVRSAAGRIMSFHVHAHQMAQERNVSVASIFEDDTSYAELIRESLSPLELAVEGIETAARVTPANILAIGEQATGDGIEEEALDEESMETINEFVLFRKTMIFTETVLKIRKFWGEQGIGFLPNEMRETLTRYSQGL